MTHETLSAAGSHAVEAGGLHSLPGGRPARAHGGSPAESLIDHYCGDCWAPCNMTDRGPLCDTHYFDRTPLCDICHAENSVVVEFGTRVCLRGDCLARARGGRSDAELAWVADQVDDLAALVTTAILDAGI